MSTSAFAIRLDRPLDRDVVRLSRACTERARRALRAPDDEAVHTARKAVKWARAVLRLVRGALLRERTRALDGALRAEGRRMGPLRDAAVAVALLDRFEADGALDGPLAARLRAAVDALRANAWDTLVADGGFEGLRAQLRALSLTPEDIAGVGLGDLRDGLARTYARGRARFAEARTMPTTEALHAWRRQVKHHGVHVRLWVPAWPLVVRARARAIDALSDTLGDDHDLAELVRHATEAGLSGADVRAVRQAVRPRREALQAAAWPLGARLYAEAPDALGDRHLAVLAAALDESGKAPALRERPRPGPRVRRRAALAPVLQTLPALAMSGPGTLSPFPPSAWIPQVRSTPAPS